MATDFFQRQSAAQRSTTWLVVMFILAVLAIVGLVSVIAFVVVQAQMKGPGRSFSDHPEQWMIPALAGAITLLVVLGGSLYKVMELRSGGGSRVAEALGGRRLYPNSQDPVERRLLNVVEEMAIASGTPVPPVFLLDEDGINAFAAGYSPSDAVLGVTRGCAQTLTREQLQGVIAHEFSHVLNGDMRMSIRLIGVLHGILLLGLTGQLIFRIFFYSGAGSRRSSGNNKNNGQAMLVILAVGIALIILGFLGTFLGNLIKAAVSRQREYLADASAVQFTRNPDGIAGALKRIGASAYGSRLQTAGAAEASHMYFAQGVWEGLSGLWATHPPLPKRIQAIDPNWDGKFPVAGSARGQVASELAAGFVGGASGAVVSDEVPVYVLDDAVDHVGEPTTEHRHYAADLVANLPVALVEATHEPYSARAVVYALLLDRDASIRSQQMLVLQKFAKPDVVSATQKLCPSVDNLDVKARLPLLEMSLPALKSISAAQYQEFRHCFIELAKADQQIDLFEWMLSQVLLRHLAPQFERTSSPRTHFYGLQKLTHECSVLLSTVASAGNSETSAQLAFAAGAKHLPEIQLSLLPKSANGLDELRSVLARLTQVSAKHRGRLVDACAAAICVDDRVKWQEAELLRGISDLLDCPMPPLLVKPQRNA